jgi:hypothetical protein
MELPINTRVYTNERGLFHSDYEPYVVGLINKVLQCVDARAVPVTSVAQGECSMRETIGMRMKKVVVTHNTVLKAAFDGVRTHPAFADKEIEQMLHGCKKTEHAECITSRGPLINESVGVQQHGLAFYATPLIEEVLKYAGNDKQFNEDGSTVLSVVHFEVITGHTPGTPWDIGVQRSAIFKPGVFAHGNRRYNPTFVAFLLQSQTNPLGYFEMESCGLGFLNTKIVQTRADSFRNDVLQQEGYHWRNMSDEQKKKEADKVTAHASAGIDLLLEVAAGGASVGGAAVGNGDVLKRVRIPTIGRHAGALVGSAAGGGAAVGGAAGGIFPGASFLPGTVRVYAADVGAICNGTTFKQDDIVTVNRVSRAMYPKVLHSDPTINKAKIQIVYNTDGNDYAMVEMLDSVRSERVQSANANANIALLSIGPSYKQAKTHMKVQLDSLAAVPPAVSQVGATAAPAGPGAAAVGVANAMHGALTGLFAAAPAKSTLLCRTANCLRYTFDGKPGYCCRTCEGGPGRHGRDCGIMHVSRQQSLESSVKKQKQEGGSGGGGGGA